MCYVFILIRMYFSEFTKYMIHAGDILPVPVVLMKYIYWWMGQFVLADTQTTSAGMEIPSTIPVNQMAYLESALC